MKDIINHMNEVITKPTSSSQTDSKEVGVSVPSKFDPLRDMVTIVRDVNDTGFSISKFEVKTRNNSILFLVEPEDARCEEGIVSVAFHECGLTSLFIV